MENVNQKFTQEQIEQRAKENNEMYFEALEDIEYWQLNQDKIARFGCREASYSW